MFPLVAAGEAPARERLFARSGVLRTSRWAEKTVRSSAFSTRSADTTFSRHGHAPLGEIDFRRGMGVGIDAEPAPKVDRLLVPPPVQIQSPRVGVDFYGDAMLGAGC